jgi:hypothetical protein
MKNIFIIIAFLSLDAYATEKNPSPIVITDDYQLYATRSDTTSVYNSYITAIDACSEMLSGLKLSYMNVTQVKCSDVIFKIRTQVPGVPEVSINLDVYCKPRPFSEMSIISLFQNCETHPQQECFEPELLNRLDKIKPTKYKDLVIPGYYADVRTLNACQIVK